VPKRKSRAWARRHAADPFVREARRQGYRSRAAYKLLELDRRWRLLRPGMAVLDLGAAPGGWTQVAAAAAGRSGRVVAIDLLPMAPVAGATAVQADIARLRDAADLEKAGVEGPFDLVICDMAPNITGVREVDDRNFVGLVEAAARIHLCALRPGGRAVTKFFQGEALDEALAIQRDTFAKVGVVRPEATKKPSRELYLIADEKRT